MCDFQIKISKSLLLVWFAHFFSENEIGRKLENILQGGTPLSYDIFFSNLCFWFRWCFFSWQSKVTLSWHDPSRCEHELQLASIYALVLAHLTKCIAENYSLNLKPIHEDIQSTPSVFHWKTPNNGRGHRLLKGCGTKDQQILYQPNEWEFRKWY